MRATTSASRRLEGLAERVELIHGIDAATHVEEGGVRFPVDPLAGQKTGFYFDQRPNRDLVARLAEGARVLDVFCHTGAFGLRCAAAGAAQVTLVDASAPALAKAEEAAALGGLAGRVAVRRGDAFDVMAELAAAGDRFEMVICDPPAFAKSRKDQEAGLRAYARMARFGAALTVPGGFLFVASCSHHAPLDLFAARIAEGLVKARRQARIRPYRRRRPGSPGASAASRDGVSQGTADPGFLTLARRRPRPRCRRDSARRRRIVTHVTSAPISLGPCAASHSTESANGE